MATSSYNPIAESISVIYKCPACGEITTSDAFNVPQPNFGAEKARDSENSEDYEAICEHCESSTPVYLYTRYDGGFIDMPDVEDIIDIQEEFPEDDSLLDDCSDELKQ